MTDRKSLVVAASIESKILLVRGHCERVELKAPGTRRRPPCGEKVMLDADLAELYAVQTKALNQAVKRNAERFPEDFMFQLTATEKAEVVTNCDHLARLKYSPSLLYAFTEHGA